MKSRWSEKQIFSFGLIFLVIFGVTFSVLYFLGLVPGEVRNDTNNSFFENTKIKLLEEYSSEENKSNEVIYEKGEEPVRILIDKVGTDILVYNPKTTDISVLDEYLKKGVVRYPGGGLLGQGNLFLFGHSGGSSISSPAFQAFNNIWKLEEGDEIKVTSESSVYIYRVTSVKLVNADEALVDFSDTGNKLTLSTCNFFGKKQERYVVEADFVKREN